VPNWSKLGLNEFWTVPSESARLESRPHVHCQILKMPSTRTKNTKSKASAPDDEENEAEHQQLDPKVSKDQETEEDEEMETEEPPKKKSSRNESKRTRKEQDDSHGIEQDDSGDELKQHSVEKSGSTKESRSMKVHVSRFIEYEPQKIVALVRTSLAQATHHSSFICNSPHPFMNFSYLTRQSGVTCRSKSAGCGDRRTTTRGTGLRSRGRTETSSCGARSRRAGIPSAFARASPPPRSAACAGRARAQVRLHAVFYRAQTASGEIFAATNSAINFGRSADRRALL
jgi:hypothetical protein